MPRAEPALSRARLPLSAVIGAAITTGITTPVPPSGPPPRTADSPLKGVLRANAGRVSCPHPLRPAARRRKAADTGRVPWGQGAVPGQPPSGYPWESDVLARLFEALRDCGLDVGESPLTVDEAAVLAGH